MKLEIRNPNRAVGCVTVERGRQLWASGFGFPLAALARRRSGSDFGFSPRWRAVATGRISDFKQFLPILFLAGVSAASAATFEVEIVPHFNGAPLVFDSVTNVTAANQTISVTRLDFLLSNFALRREDGVWLGLTNWFAYVSAREGRTSFRLEGIPAARYEAARLQIGVTPEVNQTDPAQYPPGHPLNPNVNGLHWGWAGGYVFMALEGDWWERRPPAWHVSNENNASQRAGSETGAPSGFSFHIANAPQLMTVELPLLLELDSTNALRLVLDVARIFDARHRITLAENGSATHSRTDDPLAAQLHENIERAFNVGQASRLPSERVSERMTTNAPTSSARAGERPALLYNTNATPYRLTISELFPRPALPLDNPLTVEGVALGRALFNVPLSKADQLSLVAFLKTLTDGPMGNSP